MSVSAPSLLIIGAGDLGQRLARVLDKHHWHLAGVKRHSATDNIGFPLYSADYSLPGDLDFIESLHPDYVLTTFTPCSPDVDGYRLGFTQAAENVIGGLGKHRVKRLVMVSSTRVYAQDDGDWIDETAKLSRQDERAAAIIDAEQKFLNSVQPTSIVRFAGIYGGASSRLLAKVSQGRISPAQPARYTNRIHRDDCAGFLAHLFTLAEQNQSLSQIYNGVDDEPATAHEVETWLAGEMGIGTGNLAGGSAASPARGKRISNTLMRATGYQLQYPNYRAGYGQLPGTGKLTHSRINHKP